VASINGRTRLPRFSAGQETRLLTHKQTNDFAAHEQLRAAATRNRYPALAKSRGRGREILAIECIHHTKQLCKFELKCNQVEDQREGKCNYENRY
jgi:hypothetical protein